jgi:hypothetical protein
MMEWRNNAGRVEVRSSGGTWVFICRARSSGQKHRPRESFGADSSARIASWKHLHPDAVRASDRRRNARRTYGDFAEAAIALYDLDKDLTPGE